MSMHGERSLGEAAHLAAAAVVVAAAVGVGVGAAMAAAPAEAQVAAPSRAPVSSPVLSPVSATGTRLAGSGARRDTVRVLFIGNSFTYYNNLPRLLEAIASSRGGPVVQTALAATGGATLEGHWSDSATRSLFRSRRWDWVVLNEQSTFGEAYVVDGQYRVHGWSVFADYASRWATRARQRGCRVALLMHWADRVAPARDRMALQYAFSRVGAAAHATVIPAELAWEAVRHEHPDVPLYDADGHHPAPEGSYLAASTVYAALLGRSPVGAVDTITGLAIEHTNGDVVADSIVVLAALPGPEAALLQQAAWSVVAKAPRLLGRLAMRPPPPLALPVLPAGHARPTSAQLTGTWRGESTLYPIGGPAPTQLWIGAKGEHLWGRIRVVLGPQPNQVHEGPIAVTITGRGVLLSDPDGPDRGVVRYRGVLEEGVLHGVVDFLVPDSRVHGYGSWAVHKD